MWDVMSLKSSEVTSFGKIGIFMLFYCLGINLRGCHEKKISILEEVDDYCLIAYYGIPGAP